MRHTPFVRIGVLNWNGGEMTSRCIEHLLATDWPADRLEIMVVDNGSTDGSVEQIAERYPDVRIVDNGSNLGFVGLNTALDDLATTDYVALVNNDAFVEPGWLEPLVATLEHDPGLGAAAAKMVFEPRFRELVIEAPTFRAPGDGRDLGVRVLDLGFDNESVFDRAQFVKGCFGPEPRPGGVYRWTSSPAVIRVPGTCPGTGGSLGFLDVALAAETDKQVELRCGRYRLRAEVGAEPRTIRVPMDCDTFDVVQNAGSVLIDDGFGADRGFMAIDRGQYDEPCEIFNFCGGAVLLRSRFIEDAGTFDERFFLYYEDTDLSWRGQQLGWRYAYVPASRLRHVHGASGGSTSDVFQFHVERNRLLMLAKNAPPDLAARQVIRFVTATLSYARRDLPGPLRRLRRPPLRLLRNRTRSLLSFLALLPVMIADRRRLASRRRVDDSVVCARWVRRETWTAHEQAVIDEAGRACAVAFPEWAEPMRSAS